MYTNKNKAFLLLEVVVIMAISMIVNIIVLTTFFSLNKSFILILENYKKEKEINTFMNLVKSHIEWNKSREVRVLNIDAYKKEKGIDEIFKKSEFKNEGNLLVVKIYAYNLLESKEEIYYRFFFFTENKAKISYSEDFRSYEILKILRGMEVLNDCEGRFLFDGEVIKIIIKDKKRGKIYVETQLYK